MRNDIYSSVLRERLKCNRRGIRSRISTLKEMHLHFKTPPPNVNVSVLNINYLTCFCFVKIILKKVFNSGYLIGESCITKNSFNSRLRVFLYSFVMYRVIHIRVHTWKSQKQ